MSPASTYNKLYALILFPFMVGCAWKRSNQAGFKAHFEPKKGHFIRDFVLWRPNLGCPKAWLYIIYLIYKYGFAQKKFALRKKTLKKSILLRNLYCEADFYRY